MAMWLRAVGHQDKAVAAYRKAIEIRPSFGTAYWSLANMKIAAFQRLPTSRRCRRS